MTAEILIGLVMLIVMIGAIFIGIQISFTLLFLALAFGYLALGRGAFDLPYFQTIGLMKDERLPAAPLLIFLRPLTPAAVRYACASSAPPTCLPPPPPPSPLP